MNIKRILFFLLALAIAIGVVAVGYLYIKHARIANICNLIRTGQTERAVEQITSVQDVNEYSAPLWLRPILLAMEADVELPLVVACEEGDLQIIKTLIEQGANPNKFVEGNWSPLEAVFVSRKSNRAEITETLIKSGADVNSFANKTSALFMELNALMYSYDCSETEKSESKNCVFLLLDNGANPVDAQGNTVIHYLSCTPYTDLLAAVLTDHMELVNYQNKCGQTPLMWAASTGHIESVKHLISQGAQVDVVDYSGVSAISYAEKKGYTEVVELLAKTSDGLCEP